MGKKKKGMSDSGKNGQKMYVPPPPPPKEKKKKINRSHMPMTLNNLLKSSDMQLSRSTQAQL